MSDLKIFTDNIEPEALNQVYTLIKQPAFSDCKVRIMPDVHAGAGCVIGFTANLGDKVIPGVVGVDIGCGVLTVKLKEKDIDFIKLDQVIREYIPSGRSVKEVYVWDYMLEQMKSLHCYKHLKNVEWLELSLGTLGGGNHFIEVDEDEEGYKYLIIHTGSRNLGKQVAEYYQNLAIEMMHGKGNLPQARKELIATLKATGKSHLIEQMVKELELTFRPSETKIPKDLCYLTDKNREQYLHDMDICQKFAESNRNTIANTIINKMGWGVDDVFQTVHNYIEIESNMVRKGAISAKKDQKLLIPLNMRDGCIIGIGKGNNDWNQSAPHGAGRIMSRSKAKEMLDLNEYQDTMSNIFTTSVSIHTIDEAPMAYKPSEEIVNYIKDTVEIEKIIKPVYNFKACE